MSTSNLPKHVNKLNSNTVFIITSLAYINELWKQMAVKQSSCDAGSWSTKLGECAGCENSFAAAAPDTHKRRISHSALFVAY